MIWGSVLKYFLYIEWGGIWCIEIEGGVLIWGGGCIDFGGRAILYLPTN